MNHFYTKMQVNVLFLELIFVNIIVLVICTMLYIRAFKRADLEFDWSMRIIFSRLRPGVFIENCKRYNLTKSEMKVVSLVCNGLSNREIGDKIFVSEDTIKKHVRNVFHKADVKSRMELNQVLKAGFR